MSKIVEAVTSTRGDKTRVLRDKLGPLFVDVFSVKEDFRTEPIMTETQYRIGVTLGNQVWISELDKINTDNAISMAVRRTQMQIVEAIFGEFRQDFRMIEKAIYNRDMEQAGKLLYDMEHKMFNVE